NRSVRRECNLRVFETAAAGALLFVEEENREVGCYFRDRQECVRYSDENLETLLDYYLTHEDERRTLARAGQAHVANYSFERLWQGILERLEEGWDSVRERARQRPHLDFGEALLARTWEALGSGDEVDPSFVHELSTAVAAEPNAAALRNALG